MALPSPQIPDKENLLQAHRIADAQRKNGDDHSGYPRSTNEYRQNILREYEIATQLPRFSDVDETKRDTKKHP